MQETRIGVRAPYAIDPIVQFTVGQLAESDEAMVPHRQPCLASGDLVALDGVLCRLKEVPCLRQSCTRLRAVIQ